MGTLIKYVSGFAKPETYFIRQQQQEFMSKRSERFERLACVFLYFFTNEKVKTERLQNEYRITG